ncbi:MAG: DoxX family protein [Flavobacteriaceae bacterium]|nr:DoxX family protein [Flavobacteriaceae bacterium]MDG1962375.1 DoxX family protein [Flavobacteriaceae bacterium]
MKNIKFLLMIFVPSLVLNVWLFRFNKATIYRGGDATNMIEEFAAYGLSESMVYLVGGLKVLAALGLLLGFVYRKSIAPSALVMSVLMVGAIAMHFVIGDAPIKYLPAGLMLVSSFVIFYADKKTA